MNFGSSDLVLVHGKPGHLKMSGEVSWANNLEKSANSLPAIFIALWTPILLLSLNVGWSFMDQLGQLYVNFSCYMLWTTDAFSPCVSICRLFSSVRVRNNGLQEKRWTITLVKSIVWCSFPRTDLHHEELQMPMQEHILNLLESCPDPIYLSTPVYERVWL